MGSNDIKLTKLNTSAEMNLTFGGTFLKCCSKESKYVDSLQVQINLSVNRTNMYTVVLKRYIRPGLKYTLPDLTLDIASLSMQSVKLSTFSFFIEKRYQVAKEILDTEKKYLTCLRTLKEVRFIGAC